MMKSSFTRKSFGDPRKAVDKAIGKSSLEFGVAIAAQAKLLAPVDEGQLRNSLSASNLRETKLLNNSKGEKAEKLDTQGLKGDQVYVGSNSDHNIYVEYGTIKMVAQPYLRPSVELLINNMAIEDIYKKFGAEAMEEELRQRKADFAKMKAGL
jgi:HK97 gp10 family phage protein